MKRIGLVLLMFATTAVYAQKPVKPNLNKALTQLREGKIADAKANIDAAITNEKMMNDGKTWYYRGLVYAAIDTTSNEEIKALDPDAFTTALAAFKKADELKGKTEYSILDANSIPQFKKVQVTTWANTHLNKGAAAYQEEDFETALKSFDKVALIIPDDTMAYFYGGFAAYQGEQHDRAIENFTKYLEKGGTSADAYSILNNIYAGPKQDKEKALAIIREGKQKYPENPDFPKIEIGLLIDLKKIDEAKKGLEEQIAKEPDNKILHFYLGYANANLNNNATAKKNYEDALNLDSQYFEAALFLAKLMYTDAAATKKEMSNLGITAADKKKRFDLDKVLVEQMKASLPYWERAEKINPDDQEVLDVLYSMYGDLDMQDQLKRVEKRYKELGYDN